MTHEPQKSITDLMARRHPSVQVPTGEVYLGFLDTRTMIETYLYEAALLWFEQAGTRHVGVPFLGSCTEDVVELGYYANHDDGDNDIPSFADIPVADLLPEYAAHRATLRALAG